MAEKYNNEDFIKKVKSLVGDEYTFLEEYKGSSTKIKVRHNCNLCDNYEYPVAPDKFLQGRRCPICAKTNRSKKRTKTPKKFKQEVYELVGDEYSILEDYQKSDIKIKFKHNCKLCNYNEFDMTPEGFLSGNRCPTCAKIKRGEKRRIKPEEYRKDFKNLVGNEFVLLTEYDRAEIKVRIRHNSKNCNYNEFDKIPGSFLDNPKCPKCSRMKVSNNQRKGMEQFKKEVFDLVGDEYTVLDEQYINAKTKLKMRHNCEDCNNNEFPIAPSNFLGTKNKKGTRCPICSIIKVANSQRKTQEQFEQEIYDLFGNEYTVISKYEGITKPVKIIHNCKKCHNYIWNVYPGNILNHGYTCPLCSHSITLNHEQFLDFVNDNLDNEYEVLGTYINAQTKLKMRHNCESCDNYEWDVRPADLFRFHKCPKCANNITKTQEQFEQEVYDLVENEYTVLGTYVNNQTKLKMRHNCKDCNNYEWDVSPSNFLRGKGCPICKQSHLNKNLYKILKDNDLKFISEYRFYDCKYQRPLPFDIYLKNFNICIEADGQQHFDEVSIFGGEETFEIQKEKDNIKNQYCKDNDILLIRIPYTYIDDLDSIERVIIETLKTNKIPNEILEFYKDYKFSNYYNLFNT